MRERHSRGAWKAMGNNILRAMQAAILAVMAMAGWATPGRAEPTGTTLVVAVHARPADRAALRVIMEKEQAARLKQWQSDGLLAGYRLLCTRFADTGVWDAMEILSFRDSAALSRWRAVEQQAPGGLNARAMALVTTVETVPTSDVRNEGNIAASDPAVLVIPYRSLVSAPDYLHYLDGYTIPQFKGWIGEGVLADYHIMTSTYPAGRDWNALIVLRYKDDASLARREEIVTKVRARLALDPAWKAISDDKKAIRTEGIVAIADQISGSAGQ